MKRILPVLLALSMVACGKESADKQASTFAVYPGSRSLPEITELFKTASSTGNPGKPVPPQVIYDIDGKLEDVAKFYAKQNGFDTVAPDATGNMSSVAPPAYYTSGDLHADALAAQPTFEKLNMRVDVNKAEGKYRGAYISGDHHHPRVTLTRPYFDPLHQQVVDRTLVIMVQE